MLVADGESMITPHQEKVNCTEKEQHSANSGENWVCSANDESRQGGGGIRRKERQMKTATPMLQIHRMVKPSIEAPGVFIE
jgi:hypothetical protein